MSDSPPPKIQARRLTDGTRRALADVIENCGVTPVFQPIAHLGAARIAAYESLTRIPPESGFASPAELFDAAVKENLLWELEQVTRKASLEAAGEWPEATLLFLNCCPDVFADARFPDAILTEVAAVPGIDPTRVVLELTERSDQQFIPGLAANSAQLVAEGFQLAIDDVGAGASGLNRITHLRPKWLKLDRELIDHIDRHGIKQNMVRFIQHFCRVCGAQLIAEGIEREEELACLMDIGVPYAQGYYLCRPMPRTRLDNQNTTEIIEAAHRSSSHKRHQDPRDTRVAEAARAVTRLQTHDTIAAAAEKLRADEDLPGVAVHQDLCAVGWLDRETVFVAAAEQAGPQKKLSDLPLRMPTAIEAEAPYFEILELAAARPDALASDPIMLTGDEGCDAVLYASDLFRLAARVCESLEHRVNPLTGLPGRVQCEQRVIDIMHERANPAVRTAIDPLRVAFIDIRGFNICNTVLGFQIGDQLIRTLAGIILGVIEEHNDPGAYLGHLTEDRFIMIASDEMLRRIASEVPARFNREAGHWTAGAAAAFVTSEAYKPLQIHKDDIHQTIGPRILVASPELWDANNARAVFAHGQVLKARAKADGLQPDRLGAVIVWEEDTGESTDSAAA